MTQLVCDRCGENFPRTVDHTKIIRRDFVDEPQPLKTEYLCERCVQDYEDRFLGDAFLEGDDWRR